MRSEEQPCAKPHMNISTVLMKWKLSTCSTAVSMKPKAAGTSKWSVKAMSCQQVCGVRSFMIDGWREQADSLVVGGRGVYRDALMLMI